MWNLVKLPVVMKNTQHITLPHTNAERDCYSESVQKVTLLLLKTHFLIWRNWVNQHAVVTETLRDSRHNREWVPSPKRNAHIKIKALVLLVRVEVSKICKARSWLCSTETETCGYFKGWEKALKVWKQTFELQKGPKSMEAFEKGHHLIVCVMRMLLAMPATSKISNT